MKPGSGAERGEGGGAGPAEGAIEACDPRWEEPRRPDASPAQFALPAWIAAAPFERLCGMEIVAAAGGTAHLRMPFRVKLAQGAGLMHGGALVALADTAVAMAIKSRVAEGTRFVTRELSTRFHAPVRSGVVEARASVVPRGERDLDGRAELHDADGVLVATFRAHFTVRADT